MTEPGPLPEELVRLIGAAQDWWHRTVDDPTTARIAIGAPECCWCPLCQLIATLRGERPELLDRLAETQAALTATLRALVEAAGLGGASRPSEPDQTGPSEPESHPGRPADSRVQPIPLDDEAG